MKHLKTNCACPHLFAHDLNICEPLLDVLPAVLGALSMVGSPPRKRLQDRRLEQARDASMRLGFGALRLLLREVQDAGDAREAGDGGLQGAERRAVPRALAAPLKMGEAKLGAGVGVASDSA